MCRLIGYRDLVVTQSHSEFVIRDGKFISDFDTLYANYDDPWHQSHPESRFSAHREMALLWAEKLRSGFGCQRILDFGCGLGNMAGDLSARGFDVTGIDSVARAVNKARKRVPEAKFLVGDSLTEELLSEVDPDIIIFSEVTWYLLDQLDAIRSALLDFAEKSLRPKFLIRLLEVYPEGDQRYGTDYFRNLDDILQWWRLPWIEAGKVTTRVGLERLERRSTYFVAQLLKCS